jgi:hypothetical protein
MRKLLAGPLNRAKQLETKLTREVATTSPSSTARVPNSPSSSLSPHPRSCSQALVLSSGLAA